MMIIPRIGVAVATIAASLLPQPGFSQSDFLDSVLDDVRRMESLENDQRRAVLEEILGQRGIPFALEAFDIDRPDYPRSAGTNIVVTLGTGRGGIVVGAHYDAAWLANGDISGGAVDNAASSIILTRVADALLDDNTGKRVQIVFFDAEEIGLIGSRDFVARRSDDAIEVAINLDINAYGDTIFYGPTMPGGFDDLYRAIDTVCGELRFNCEPFGRYPASDYLSFRSLGIPYVSLALLPQDEVVELADALNPAAGSGPRGSMPRILQVIHSPEDRSTLVEPEAMAITYATVLGLIMRLAQ